MIQVISRNEILKSGDIKHNPRRQKLNLHDLKNVIGHAGKFVDSEKSVDRFNFNLSLDSNVYTKTNLLIYYIAGDEIVVANADINVEKCLPNSVSLIKEPVTI